MTDPDRTPPAPAERPSGVLRRACGGVLRGVVHWMPVWAPLGLLAQFGLLGLRPALREHQRLERAEERLERRLDGLREQRRALVMEVGAFRDPIYRERLRRLRD